jgi:hypothetical protein
MEVLEKKTCMNTIKYQAMKKFLLFLFILALNDCYAATGSASDGVLFVGSIMVIMLLLLALGYLIDFLKSRIRKAMTKRWLKKDMENHDGEFIRFTHETV